MKTVKSALLGTKNLIDTNAEVILLQLREIIKEHRALVITRLISDLPTYLNYRFETKASKDQLVKAKEKLQDLKNGSVDLKAYDNIVQLLLNRAVVHLTNEPFYKEIDECLLAFVSEHEIKFNQ